MPTVKDKTTGDVVSQQPYTPEGTQRAKQIADTDANWELNYTPNGQTDGAKRSETMYAGGGKTGYSNIGGDVLGETRWYGAPKPDEPMREIDEYKKGGKTKSDKRKAFEIDYEWNPVSSAGRIKKRLGIGAGEFDRQQSGEAVGDKRTTEKMRKSAVNQKLRKLDRKSKRKSK